MQGIGRNSTPGLPPNPRNPGSSNPGGAGEAGPSQAGPSQAGPSRSSTPGPSGQSGEDRTGERMPPRPRPGAATPAIHSTAPRRPENNVYPEALLGLAVPRNGPDPFPPGPLRAGTPGLPFDMLDMPARPLEPTPLDQLEHDLETLRQEPPERPRPCNPSDPILNPKPRRRG